jgi:outer membrane protein assembly factor BamA
VRAALDVPLGAAGARAQLGGGYRIRPNARFFGFGPDAAAADKSYYRQQATWLGAAYERPLGSRVTLEGQLLWTEIGAGATEAEQPPLADQFAAALPPGYGRHVGGLSASLGVAYDNTTHTGRPARGGVRRFRAVAFRGIGGAPSTFASYRGELQQFFTVGYRHHVVALRAVASWMAPLDDRPIPFQYLLTNDDPDLLRGYQDFRWRDRGLALASAEYRWPLWAMADAEGPGVDVYLLADVGQVFAAASQLATSNLAASYGVGLRLLSRNGLIVRFEYGRGREEWVLRLRGDQVFQFARNALFHGRDPVPFR